jgi:type 1 glutamine amidotransferase
VKSLPGRRAHLIAAGNYHDMDFARLELLKLLAELPSVRTSVAGDYGDVGKLATANLLITYTCDFAPDSEQTMALRAFLDRGGRWLALHGTNAVLDFLADGRIGAAAGHDAFMDLVGTRFLAHPPIGPFLVEVAEPDHQLTAGIDPFEVIDELYLFERRGGLRTLLSTRFTGSCAPFATAGWDTSDAPVMYLHPVGEGEVLYLSLGHCRSHYDPSPNGAFVTHPLRCAWNYPVYYELLRRALRWGLGL